VSLSTPSHQITDCLGAYVWLAAALARARAARLQVGEPRRQVERAAEMAAEVLQALRARAQARGGRRAQQLLRAPPQTRRRPLRARASALAPRAAAPCRTPFRFAHCAASTFQGTTAYLALRTGTISTAACPRNVWSPAGRGSLGARTRVLRRGRDQVAEQLAVGCLHEALEQHADRDEELRAPDGEREVDRAVCQVVAAHGRGRLVRPHAPARARAAGSPGCARRQRSLQKPSMYQKLQPCTITTTSVHFP